ncbi:integral membrane protein [Patellaria atrata CBS 101060]|uniref:Integral membrane protein n=1 Tax=Patellaria atrata CBS 101060 TaxID=1346257 RepID=A0A9P4SAY5_9PEZI|nr:integral membrane protein [Patellaria atrata CBS 101060]
MMNSHILLMMIGWTVLLPLGVMFSIARSRYTLLTQSLFLLVNGLGLLTACIYNTTTPDLYPNNSHHKLGWALTWILSSWVIMGIVNRYTSSKKVNVTAVAEGLLVSAGAVAEYHRLPHTQEYDESRWSRDSGQGTERNSASFCSQSRSPSVESENQQFQDPVHQYDEEDDQTDEKDGFLKDSRVDRFMKRNVSRIAFGRSLGVLRFFYVAIERLILVLGFVALATGIVTYSGIARGDAVFNILAHFIKGGIFFWYGLLTLGRWMGCFADFGWAWNIKPTANIVGHHKARIPSAEFTESFVIWLYGASNVWLEHLAAWGSEWTAQDLEHVSISILFFGGGALGMLIESRKVRSLLNTTITGSRGTTTSDPSWIAPPTYRFPYNPLPGLIILLLGLMMGSHHQASMLSTMIHKQWGNLFVGFALARAATYVILYISPPTSFLPSRPPTELIASFCLIAGGLIFMESNKNTVTALEANGLDAMFTFTVTMGLVTLSMAWVVALVAVKGWATRKEKGVVALNATQELA